MIFVYNTIHAHLRTGWFPAEHLYSDIRSVGVLRFLYMYLEGVKLFCEDMLRREGAGIWIARRQSLHVKNVFVQESGTMAPIKISVYMKFASLYHSQQLCSCDYASLKRFVKST